MKFCKRLCENSMFDSFEIRKLLTFIKEKKILHTSQKHKVLLNDIFPVNVSIKKETFLIITVGNTDIIVSPSMCRNCLKNVITPKAIVIG